MSILMKKTKKRTSLNIATPQIETKQAKSASFSQLQHGIGNRALQRAVNSGAIQAKLSVSQPSDSYEREADRVADEVLTMSDAKVQTKSPINIQRKSESSGSSQELSSHTESKINSLQGRGEALSSETRSFFEPRFGQDFSDVRVHTDSSSNSLAGSINARAFTYGNNIVFGSSEYSPNSTSGKRLLGHELAHVVQQKSMSSSTVARQEKVAGAKTESKVKPVDQALEEWKKSKLIRLHFGTLANYKILKPLYKKYKITNINKWIKNNIKTVSFFGKKTQVHKTLKTPIKNAETSIKKSSTAIAPVVVNFGSFVPRKIRGRKSLSYHAFGKAIDFNYKTNPLMRNRKEFKIFKFIKAIVGVDLLAEKSYKSQKKASDNFKTFYPFYVFLSKLLLKGLNYVEINVSLTKKEKKALNKLTIKQKKYIRSLNTNILKKISKTGFLNLDSRIVKALVSQGFRWGGSWGKSKDYMHFEMGKKG